MTTIPQPPTVDSTITERLRAFDVQRMALYVEIYAAGRTDVTYGRYEASTPQIAELLDVIHTAWMESLCRTSAGLLPFDDSAEPRAAPPWLLQAQEGKVGR